MRHTLLICCAVPGLMCCAVSGVASQAAAQDAPATTRLQDAEVVARGNTISITRLPIHTATGTIYRDVKIELQVDAQGHVTLATDAAGRAVAEGMPRQPAAAQSGRQTRVALQAVPSGQPIELPQQASPPIVYQSFTAGTYTAADGSLIQVQNRGMDLIHHVPAWSLTSPTGSYITSATWYSGPPFMNPRSRRLKRAEITSTQYAYGTSDEGSGAVFGSGALIGVQQMGRQLKIVSFHHGCCTDEPEPVASLTYTLVGH